MNAEETIRKIVQENKNIIEKKGDRAVSALMGECMKALRGKVDGKIVNEILLREIRKYNKYEKGNENERCK